MKTKHLGKNIHYDFKISDGFYCITEQDYIKSNAKDFEIEYNLPKVKNGLSFTHNKRGSIIFVTCVLYTDEGLLWNQFLIKRNCKKNVLINHNCPDVIKKDLLHAYEVLNTETFGELLDLNENYNNN